MAKVDEEHREYERFPIGFIVDIHLQQPDGALKRIEATELEDVSDGGVRFSSKHPDIYEVGQQVHLCITMPGMGVVKAVMQGEASVTWVGCWEGDTFSVGLKLDDPLDFSREPNA